MVLSTADCGFIRTFLKSRSAIVIDEGKEYLIESRLSQLLDETGHNDLLSLVEDLRVKPKGPLGDRVVDALTTNETSWFRDRRPFEALEHVLLPKLIAARAEKRSLSIWSAASSSGQEAYSIAMLILERFPELATWRLEIVGTDLSKEMVSRAKSAIYSQIEVNRGLPAAMLVKYFTREGANWVLAPRIRNMVSFREMNLVGPWPPIGPFDLVLCRNVLIYFDLETKRSVLGKIAHVMHQDSALALGGAETTLHITGRFERFEECGYSWYRLSAGNKESAL